jgi:F0F1-type ATP synthase assembly protein I
VHAFGVAAILIVITLLVGVVLAIALAGFAENGQVVAIALSQIVLSPFFFIGLTVLYFEQRARAEERGQGRS